MDITCHATLCSIHTGIRIHDAQTVGANKVQGQLLQENTEEEDDDFDDPV